MPTTTRYLFASENSAFMTSAAAAAAPDAPDVAASASGRSRRGGARATARATATARSPLDLAPAFPSFATERAASPCFLGPVTRQFFVGPEGP